jgi:YHS domain-containing protein
MGRIFAYLLELVTAVVFAGIIRRAIKLLVGSPHLHFTVRSGARPVDKAREVHGGKTARDPVCGMFVSTEVSHRLNQGTEILHFCSQKCLEAYRKDHADA